MTRQKEVSVISLAGAKLLAGLAAFLQDAVKLPLDGAFGHLFRISRHRARSCFSLRDMRYYVQTVLLLHTYVTAYIRHDMHTVLPDHGV